jgi:CubicO group peptidase (beta-lactamase class C family)
LKPSTIELMRTSVLDPGVQVKFGSYVLDNLGFGLGVGIVQNQGQRQSSQRVGSYFWRGLFGTWFWIDPTNEVIVMGFINELDWGKKVPLITEICAKWLYRALKE